MAKYKIHKDFSNLKLVPNTKKILILPINKLSKWQFNTAKVPDNIEFSSHKLKVTANEEIEISVFKPRNISKNAPCLVYLHGGGFFLEALAIHKKMMCEYAEKVNCIIIFPHYRLSSKNPFPAGFNDCYAALIWTKENAKMLNIDTNKIAIGGESAGGNLAACVAQKNFDKKEINLCFQLLIYPVCDHTLSTYSMQLFTDTPMFNTSGARLMWDMYLKGIDQNNLPNYVSSLQRENLQGLPPAYIETAEYDCLCDEAFLYEEKLKDFNVKVELNQTEGTVHAYDIIRKSDITEESINRRIKALRRAFYGK